VFPRWIGLSFGNAVGTSHADGVGAMCKTSFVETPSFLERIKILGNYLFKYIIMFVALMSLYFLCVLLYFILWIATVRSLNLFWIQIGLIFIKELEIVKTLLFLIAEWAETLHRSSPAPPPPSHTWPSWGLATGQLPPTPVPDTDPTWPLTCTGVRTRIKFISNRIHPLLDFLVIFRVWSRIRDRID
jgi:hypothetical protein